MEFPTRDEVITYLKSLSQDSILGTLNCCPFDKIVSGLNPELDKDFNGVYWGLWYPVKRGESKCLPQYANDCIRAIDNSNISWNKFTVADILRIVKEN